MFCVVKQTNGREKMRCLNVGAGQDVGGNKESKIVPRLFVECKICKVSTLLATWALSLFNNSINELSSFFHS